MKSLGRLDHDTKQFRVKSFGDINMLEVTILHELFHTQQTPNPQGKLNLEIEAHLITYRYALRTNRIELPSNSITMAMMVLNEELDIRYIPKESGLDVTYDYVIDEMRKNSTYNAKDYPESSSARTFGTANKLSEDCKN